MASFRYRAVRAGGELVEGDMEAPTKAAVMTRLADMGYVPIRADEVGRGMLSRLLAIELFGGGGRVGQRDLMVASRELATLLDAGIELERALDMLVALSERPALQRTFTAVLGDVRGGSTFADALEASGGAFPASYVGMVRAGEAGGSLALVVGRIAEYLERAQKSRETVRSALIYPVILLIMAVASVIIMVTVVLPQFAPLFAGSKVELPLLTQGLLAVSGFVGRTWWAICAAVLFAVVFARRRLRVPAVRERFDRHLLELPVVSELIVRLETARLGRTLGTLLQNGVATIDALNIACATVVNRHFSGALAQVAELVKSGATISESLDRVPRFPVLARHLIRIGEETGRLEEMLLRVAEIYDEEAQRTVRRLLALLVPGLTAVLGVIVAVIISSVFLAIVRVNQLAF